MRKDAALLAATIAGLKGNLFAVTGRADQATECYVAAIRAAQLGLNVACVELERALGGTCLRIGCIPSKALLDSSGLYDAAGHEFAGRGITVGKLGLDLPTMLAHKDQVVKGLTGGVDSLFKKNKVTRYFGRGRLDGERERREWVLALAAHAQQRLAGDEALQSGASREQ